MGPEIGTVVLSTTVVVTGWVVGHWFNVQRDTSLKRRELRVKYLLDAYRRLEDATGRSSLPIDEVKRAFEAAVADIQILGTKEQIDALLEYLDGFLRDPTGRIDPVLTLLRDEIRIELRLDLNIPPIHQFRFDRSLAKVEIEERD